jgi:hypothetical protein
VCVERVLLQRRGRRCMGGMGVACLMDCKRHSFAASTSVLTTCRCCNAATQSVQQLLLL